MTDKIVTLHFFDSANHQYIKAFMGFESMDQAEAYGHIQASIMSASEKKPIFLTKVFLDSNNFVLLPSLSSGCYGDITLVRGEDYSV